MNQFSLFLFQYCYTFRVIGDGSQMRFVNVDDGASFVVSMDCFSIPNVCATDGRVHFVVKQHARLLKSTAAWFSSTSTLSIDLMTLELSDDFDD